MQIVDDEVPFILGADFLLEHDCLINYRTQEMRIPPTETEMASSTPITVNGTAKDHMVAALFPSEGCPTPETPEMVEQHTVVAIKDEIIWPGHYAHVDLRVQEVNNLHESDKLHLESSLMVVTDPDSIAEAEVIEFQEDPWGYNTCSLAKTLYDRARLAQVEAVRKQGLAPAMFNAIVTPWIDEGTDWVGISSIIHNTGLEPIILRTNQPVGTASVITNMDQGPQLLQTTATTEAEPNEYSSLTMAAIQEQIVEGKQFRLPEGDWRKGQTGRQVINHIQ